MEAEKLEILTQYLILAPIISPDMPLIMQGQEVRQYSIWQILKVPAKPYPQYPNEQPSKLLCLVQMFEGLWGSQGLVDIKQNLFQGGYIRKLRHIEWHHF